MKTNLGVVKLSAMDLDFVKHDSVALFHEFLKTLIIKSEKLLLVGFSKKTNQCPLVGYHD